MVGWDRRNGSKSGEKLARGKFERTCGIWAKARMKKKGLGKRLKKGRQAPAADQKTACANWGKFIRLTLELRRKRGDGQK